MKIKFYFDPSCPFCWIASRWILLVSEHRDIEIDWQTFSLAIKNNELEEPEDSKHSGAHLGAHRVLRVMQAAKEKSDKSLIDLYSTFGFQFHVNGRDYDDELVKDVLKELQLPEDLIKEADNIKHDDKLKRSIEDATDVVGEDIGVPTIVFENDKGDLNGYFGPVFNAMPDKEEALNIWDGLSKLASSNNFYELKRDRPSGGPDTASTAVCEF